MSEPNWYEQNVIQAGGAAVAVLGSWSAWLTRRVMALSEREAAGKVRDDATMDMHTLLMDEMKTSRDESTKQHEDLRKEMRADLRVLHTALIGGRVAPPREDD